MHRWVTLRSLRGCDEPSLQQSQRHARKAFPFSLAAWFSTVDTAIVRGDFLTCKYIL